MRLLLITNPLAGMGRARRNVHTLVSGLRARGATVRLEWTLHPGHAQEIARTADPEFDALVAVGGDGTVHEVAQGIIDAGGRHVLALAPFGSGNDYARTIGMPSQPDDVAEALMTAHVRELDYGRIMWEGEGESGSDIFVNAVGCGFDAYVAREIIRYKRWRGFARYFVTALRSLRHWHFPEVSIVNEGAFQWHDRLLLCSAGIGSSVGGGFILTPKADAADGVYDICIARRMSLVRILRVLPLAMRGRHLDEPEIEYRRAVRFELSAEYAVPVHLDGEVLPADVRSFRVTIVPSGLRVLCAS